MWIRLSGEAGIFLLMVFIGRLGVVFSAVLQVILVQTWRFSRSFPAFFPMTVLITVPCLGGSWAGDPDTLGNGNKRSLSSFRNMLMISANCYLHWSLVKIRVVLHHSGRKIISDILWFIPSIEKNHLINAKSVTVYLLTGISHLMSFLIVTQIRLMTVPFLFPSMNYQDSFSEGCSRYQLSLTSSYLGEIFQ